jgi:MFS family permease
MRFRGPLADSYGGAVLLVLLALTPYLVLSTALQPLQPLIAKDLGLSARAMGLTSGMANAAYAFGAVLAVQIGSRVRPRRMLVVYATLFTTGSALAAWAPVAGLYVAGHVTQGLATGLLLIGSVPPLVLSWGTDKLPRTAIVMNLGIFGAVALGPVVGGVAAGTGSWRPLLWIICAVGSAALAFALLTFEDAEAQDPDAPVDIIALVLAAGGCAAAFFGVSELMGRRVIDATVLVAVLAGLGMLVGLVVHQWRSDDPLIPVRKIAHTVPVLAIVIAMAAGAASVALVQLAQTALQMKGVAPRHAGMLFWPEIGMALVAALIFSRLFFTRYTPLLALGGLAVLAVGGVVLTGAARGGDALVVVGSGLVGFGVGASVSPALFLAGFSLPSADLPRVFAFIELLRGVAAFLVGPALLQLAMTTKPPVDGLRDATWIATGVAVAGLLLATAVAVAGRMRLHVPDVEGWQAGETTAIPSPPIADAVRGSR